MSLHGITWPEGKKFALTVFDDPDKQTLAQCRDVYGFLSDQGFRTTIGAWMLEPGPERRNSDGETCENPEYRLWLQELQRRGFEIGMHCAAPGSTKREEIIRAFEMFHEYFGPAPITMANHYNEDAIYWGPARLSGSSQWLYNLATLGRKMGRFFGEQPNHPSFWGDLCQEHVRYCRNFVFRELNTLKACPIMPYHDPDRPFVKQWYASAEASNLPRFLERVTEESMDQLEEEGGAAIIYTHFGHGYFDSGSLDSRFKALMSRLAKKNGWFVPVGTLLPFLESQGAGQVIQPDYRAQMERRWLWAKLRHGTS